MQEVLDILRMFWPLLALQIILFIWAIIDLAKRREVKVLPRWAWVLIILLINIFGPIIYFVAGRGEE